MAERSKEELEALVAFYESNGVAKLYYSLNRKMNEMGDLMNKHTLSNMEIGDPKDKTFERLKAIWEDASSIASAVEALGKIAKVTGDEQADIARKPFVDSIATTRT